MYIAYKEKDVSDFAQFKFRIPNCLSGVCNKLHFAVQGCMGLTGGALWAYGCSGPCEFKQWPWFNIMPPFVIMTSQSYIKSRNRKSQGIHQIALDSSHIEAKQMIK